MPEYPLSQVTQSIDSAATSYSSSSNVQARPSTHHHTHTSHDPSMLIDWTEIDHDGEEVKTIDRIASAPTPSSIHSHSSSSSIHRYVPFRGAEEKNEKVAMLVDMGFAATTAGKKIKEKANVMQWRWSSELFMERNVCVMGISLFFCLIW